MFHVGNHSVYNLTDSKENPSYKTDFKGLVYYLFSLLSLGMVLVVVVLDF